MTEEEGGEAAEEEEVWHAIVDRKAGELAGEDTKMLEKNFSLELRGSPEIVTEKWGGRRHGFV